MVEEVDLPAAPAGLARLRGGELHEVAARERARELGHPAALAAEQHDARARVGGLLVERRQRGGGRRRQRDEGAARRLARLRRGAVAHAQHGRARLAVGRDAQLLRLGDARGELAALHAVDLTLVARVQAVVVLRLHAVPEGAPARLTQHPVGGEVAVPGARGRGGGRGCVRSSGRQGAAGAEVEVARERGVEGKGRGGGGGGRWWRRPGGEGEVEGRGRWRWRTCSSSWARRRC